MAYLGKSPNGSGVRTKFVYTASGSETSLSGADDNGNTLKFSDGEYVDVYLNGVLLVHGSDYGTGTTNTISSLNALTANDVVEILVYDIFTMAKVNSEVIRSRYYKTASGSETSISGADDSGATITFAANAEIEVKVNGVSLVQGTDYNTSSANTVGGLSALTAGQVVEIIVYTKFTLGDTVSKADGGTFGGNIGINGDLTVDTTTLKVDSSNNRVGIGTASPAVLIHGTASAPELRITSSSDSNTPAARMFYTAGSGWNFRLGDAANNEDVKISTHGDSYFNGGNVGIGTASPAFGSGSGLEVEKSDTATIRVERTGSTASAGEFFAGNDKVVIGSTSNTHLQFRTNGSEKVRIDSSGNVGIGTTTLTDKLNVEGDIRINNAIESPNNLNLEAENGSMRFYTGAGSPSERMRIDFGGSVQINTTANQVGSGEILSVSVGSGSVGAGFAGTATDIMGIWHKSTGGGKAINFFSQPAGNNVGNITLGTSSTAYNTSSDYRLKQGVEDMTGAIDRVKALAPKRFQFIADADRTVDGFLAHEAQTVVPEAVTGTKDEVDEDGNAVMQGIDQAKLVPLLTAALQEAIARIEALEAGE